MLTISLLFIEIYKSPGQITREFLGLRIRNFRGNAFILTQTYREVFKSTLVYLQEMTRLLSTCTLNILTIVNIYIICLLIITALKSQLSLDRLHELLGYAQQRRFSKIKKRK